MDNYDPQELLALIHRIKSWSDRSLPVDKRCELLVLLNKELASIKETKIYLNQLSITRAMGIKIAQA